MGEGADGGGIGEDRDEAVGVAFGVGDTGHEGDGGDVSCVGRMGEGMLGKVLRTVFLLWLSDPKVEVESPVPVTSVRMDNGELKTVDANGKVIIFYRYKHLGKNRSITIHPQLIATIERAIKQGLSAQAIIAIYRSELRKINPQSRQLRGRK